VNKYRIEPKQREFIPQTVVRKLTKHRNTEESRNGNIIPAMYKQTYQYTAVTLAVG
jgi:hypothetical protein